MTVKEMLGQKLIFGFQGESLSAEFVQLVKEYKIGNVILFQRNVNSASQLRKLCGEIQDLIRRETGHPAFIVIDQEGGMVSRLPWDAVNVPGAMALAATGKAENAAQAARITIRQLRGLGVNVNLGPVLDVNSNPSNPVIGVRSFGDEAERVAEFGLAQIEQYRNSGILCCAKHFPGHGDTAVDSHLGIPRVEKSQEQLEKLELIPFRRAIEAGIPAVMISHVLFPNIGGDGVPCTMSRYFITELLKKKLGFQGLVISDCMEMLAIQNNYGTPEGCVAAIQAGMDLVEVSSSMSLQWASAQAVNQAAETGKLDLEEIRASAQKILACKETLSQELNVAHCNLEADRKASREMAWQAVTCWQGQPPRADSRTFFCGCVDYRASGAANESGGEESFVSYMTRAFQAPGVVSAKNPGDEEIQDVIAQARHWEKIVLATCNGHLFRGQIALAKALVSTGKPLWVVALRNPYDLPLLPQCQGKLAVFDYSKDAFAGLEGVFRGAEAMGTMPVRL